MNTVVKAVLAAIVTFVVFGAGLYAGILDTQDEVVAAIQRTEKLAQEMALKTKREANERVIQAFATAERAQLVAEDQADLLGKQISKTIGYQNELLEVRQELLATTKELLKQQKENLHLLKIVKEEAERTLEEERKKQRESSNPPPGLL
jgi:hypothetical protein